MHRSEWHGEADGFEPGPGPPRLRQQGRRISPLWQAAVFRCVQKTWKKVVKKCWQEGRGVVLYLSAKRWAKRTTSSSSARSPWKEPMSVQMFRFVPRNSWTIQVQKVQKLRKKDLTKNHFGGKINKSSAERLRRTGPWKLNNIEKLVRNLYVFGKTLKTIPKVIHTGRKRLRAEQTRFNTFKW